MNKQQLHNRLHRNHQHLTYLRTQGRSNMNDREIANAKSRCMELLIDLELALDIKPSTERQDYDSRYKTISSIMTGVGPQPEPSQTVGVRSDPTKPSLALVKILEAAERGIASLDSLGSNVSTSERLVAMQEGQIYGLLGLLEEHFKLSPVDAELTIPERYWKLHSKIHR